MLGDAMSFIARTIHITVEHSWKMEIYRERPRRCKLRRCAVDLHGSVGKDVVRHQSRPTSRYEERCCETLLDFILL